jgi:circadian clock protein KaiC
VGGGGTVEEATDLQISTIADTWLHVAYRLQGGERNRSLSIVKSRGMAHSNQVRELILSAAGITLTDVYVEGGDVLMGTARFEKEQAARTQESQLRQMTEQRRLELEEQKEALAEQLNTLQRQLEARQQELDRLTQHQDVRSASEQEMREELRRLRDGAGDHAGHRTGG